MNIITRLCPRLETDGAMLGDVALNLIQLLDIDDTRVIESVLKVRIRSVIDR